MPDGQMTTREVAEFLKVEEVTVRAYHARGQMPVPDGRLGSTPWWRTETITEWEANRTSAARSQHSQ